MQLSTQAELGVLGHLRLHEQRAPLRVEPERRAAGRRETRVRCAQQRRVVPGGDRVQVDHAVEGVVGVLHRHPVAHRAQVVAEVERVGGRLDAGEHPGTARTSAASDMPAILSAVGNPARRPRLVRWSTSLRQDATPESADGARTRTQAGQRREQALGELYHACYRRLVAQVYAFTTDLTEAQDVVQEAFARALARPRRPGRRGHARRRGCARSRSTSSAGAGGAASCSTRSCCGTGR